VDGRNIKMNQVIENNIKNFFHGRVFKSRITINTALNKAQLEGYPVFHSHNTSSGAQNYQALAEEVLKKLKRQKVSGSQLRGLQRKAG
jgi:chromosome partitioning protein